MELQTIRQVAKTYDISPRMLRYYEQIGLIQAARNAENDYRTYDAPTCTRIQQIILLRKLQIPVKQISTILDNPDTVAVIDIFKEKISLLNREISALSTIKSILEAFVEDIEKITAVHMNLDLLTDNGIQRMAEALSMVQRNIKERLTMSDLNKAADIINKLRDVRVIFLPPMTVAAICVQGENAQEKAWQALLDFVADSGLRSKKPDLRVFRFDNADINNSNNGGYEIWVSIPEDFAVPETFTKKQFLGGQYAAHGMGANGFETWLGLQDWVNESEKYQFDPGLNRCHPPIADNVGFGGMNLNLEEVLNFYSERSQRSPDGENQIDLLLSIKNYEMVEEAPAELVGSKEKCGYRASLAAKKKFRVMGFTKIMTPESSDIQGFEKDVQADGRWEILMQHKRPGAPVLGYGSHDLDSQKRGGWRWTICLAEEDITDVEGFMKHDLYVETIDASKWLIFEYPKGEAFDDHAVCMKLGYTWNGVISGSFLVTPEENGKAPGAEETGALAYCWYPVK